MTTNQLMVKNHPELFTQDYGKDETYQVFIREHEDWDVLIMCESLSEKEILLDVKKHFLTHEWIILTLHVINDGTDYIIKQDHYSAMEPPVWGRNAKRLWRF